MVINSIVYHKIQNIHSQDYGDDGEMVGRRELRGLSSEFTTVEVC